MTYENEPERRKASVGGKVLIFGFAILASLGAFWTVVWFIRSYVEQPRIALRAPMTLASRENEPAPAPKEPVVAAATVPAPAAPEAPPPPARTAAAAPAQPAADTMTAGPIADRWFPTPSSQWPEPANGAPPVPMTATAPATPPEPATATPENDQAEPEVVVASMEPAIRGAVPKPRPKPPSNSISARLREPPLPRPRPDGQTQPQSVWTAVPPPDDRFPATSQ
jgi:hypothetical protein